MPTFARLLFPIIASKSPLVTTLVAMAFIHFPTVLLGSSMSKTDSAMWMFHARTLS